VPRPKTTMTLPKGPDSLCFDKDEFMKVGLLYRSTIEPVFSCTVNLISCLVCVLYLYFEVLLDQLNTVQTLLTLFFGETIRNI